MYHFCNLFLKTENAENKISRNITKKIEIKIANKWKNRNSSLILMNHIVFWFIQDTEWRQR